MGPLGWNLGGRWGHTIAALPPGGAHIGHQGGSQRIKSAISQLYVGQFGWNFGGWWGQAIATLPPGGSHIGHQGVLLEDKKCYFSAVCGSIGLKLWWVMGTGHSYFATRWSPHRPPGGGTRGEKVLFLSCTWSNWVETWVGGGDTP